MGNEPGRGKLRRFDPSTGKKSGERARNHPAGIAAAPQGRTRRSSRSELQHRGRRLPSWRCDPALNSIYRLGVRTPTADPVPDQRRSRRLPQGRWRRGHATGARSRGRASEADGQWEVVHVPSAVGHPLLEREVRPAGGLQAWKLERLFEVGGAENGADYSKIVGADRCTAGKPCNLDSGIVVDRTAHTVTFHLTAPDPDFLAKLAQPGTFAVPAGTPARDVGVHPLPATGRTEPRSSGERRRLCVSSATASSTSGRRTRSRRDIRIRSRFRGVGSAPTDPAQIRAVERGAGDVALRRSLRPDTVQGRAREALGALPEPAPSEHRGPPPRTSSSTRGSRPSTTFAYAGRSTSPSTVNCSRGRTAARSPPPVGTYLQAPLGTVPPARTARAG